VPVVGRAIRGDGGVMWAVILSLSTVIVDARMIFMNDLLSSYLLLMPMVVVCTVDGYPHWKVIDYLYMINYWKTCDKADQRIP
jgi:hypothetical protein